MRPRPQIVASVSRLGRNLLRTWFGLDVILMENSM